jgi:glycerol-3-phosphate O-acyltransferase/dihydroxyacetone phosphate acyltransferase
MWLLPAFPAVAAFACRTFYQLEVTGARVPERGPVLLVANHPNSLLDPFVVTVAAQRPVRFLAKAPLLRDPLIGWGVRAVGAIPVYRRMDDPTQIGRNKETFSAVYDALAGGSAVGIFPEGISHDYPSLVPLKTGAARIALGAVAQVGGAFPLVPVGSIFEAKDEFRSRAHLVVGEPVKWSDLAGRNAEDSEAVRILTNRIQDAMHSVTVNYERLEDGPLVAAAMSIYDAELGSRSTPIPRFDRRATAARMLAELRREGSDDATALANEIQRHTRILSLLDLTPADVHRPSDIGSAMKWTIRRLHLEQLISAVVVSIGAIVFWVPYRLTRQVARRTSHATDTLATHKLMYGSVVFTVWVVLLTIGAGVWFGWAAAAVTLLGLPALALGTLSYGERWRGALRDARSYLTVRTRRQELEKLRERQRVLAERLRAIWAETKPLQHLRASPQDMSST